MMGSGLGGGGGGGGGRVSVQQILQAIHPKSILRIREPVEPSNL